MNVQAGSDMTWDNMDLRTAKHLAEREFGDSPGTGLEASATQFGVLGLHAFFAAGERYREDEARRNERISQLEAIVAILLEKNERLRQQLFFGMDS